ncbi:MAG TPA: 23S rRNA (guanosine(2251)-2'-O)-methyltransferase RlmB [Acholeplasmataceae bacterium]|jgi:23S rRNA (guanosine2251-2'-O)-methyltransferase|nr:23S rRNA (guanosine(2251)-2'-O)-methyltransferase RlmB [Acholeplasmataceae bacterium]
MSEAIYGTNLIVSAIRHGAEIRNLKIYNNKTVQTLAEEYGIKYEFVSKEELNRITPNHQGAVAEVEEFKTYSLEELVSERKNLILVLDGIEDPHNLGAILRTADAAQVAGIVLPKNRSVRLTGTVARVSTGAIFTVKCAVVNNLNSALNKLKERGYWIYGAEAVAESRPYDEVEYDRKTVLVLGSEGKGLSRLVRESCDFLVKIPLFGTVNSLNVSVAAGILIYHITKHQ